MKKTITSLLFLTAFSSVSLMAQIPCSSPIPVKFKVSTDAGYTNTFSYSGAGWGMDTLTQTLSAPLVWAVDINGDTLCCDSIAMDLTGKIAMIRRLTCNFSLKMLWAQKAGAVGVIIADRLENSTGHFCMGDGGEGSQIHIPAIMISKEDAAIIDGKIRAGQTVTATFEVGSFGGPTSYYSLFTPVNGAVPLEDVGITYINITPDILPSITLTVDFKDPGGNVTTISKTLTDLPGLSVNSVTMDDSYLPTMVGEYNVHYSNSLSDETFDKKFYITDYTYAQDNGVVDTTKSGTSYNGTIEPSDADFISTDNFTYDFGNFYRTGSQEQTATHVTFILGPYNELWTGDPEADVFKVRIFDADPDGNGEVPGGATTYDALDEADGSNPPIGAADYILDGATPDFTPITLELDEPVTLGANNIYLVMVQYNGLNAGIGVPPKPAFGGIEPVAAGLGSAIFSDRFYTGGFGGGYKFFVRLHVDGFTDAKEEPLDKSKISIAPNPVSSVLNLNLSLEKAADKVDLRVMDFTGRLVKTERLENVHQGTYSLNVQDLAVGTYFLSVRTPEGFRAKKFVVAR